MDQDQPAIEVYGQILIHTDLSRLYDQNFTLRYVDPMESPSMLVTLIKNHRLAGIYVPSHYSETTNFCSKRL